MPGRRVPRCGFPRGSPTVVQALQTRDIGSGTEEVAGRAAYKIGRHLMFDEADVRAWLEARWTTSANDDEPDVPTGIDGRDRSTVPRSDSVRDCTGRQSCRWLV